MALDKQIYCYSIDTSGFYNEEEQEIQNRLLELYLLKKKIFDKKFIAKNPTTIDLDFWKPNINKLIRQEKDKLSALLDERLNDTTPRVLRQDGLKEKNIITLFESSLTRALGAKTNELTMDLMVLSVYFFQVFHNLVRDGFMYNGEKYIFLTASAGQIRKKMGVFIRESAYKKIEPKIMCGLTKDKINEKGGMNTNKFASYLALNSSATDVWEDFDIDKAIVVEDFETNVFAPVDYIDYSTYEVVRKEMDVPIPHMDGAGIMLDRGTRMVRMPWIKGLLITFPFDKFIEEKCDGKGVVYDIYGEKHDVIAEGIRYILSKTQFKLHKFFDSWEEYKDNFKKYHCEACYCNLEEDFIPKAKINYQMLQTLSDISDDEIERIIRKTAKEIEAIGTDFQTTMRLLGATPNNKNPNYFQQGLMIYPELFRDVYHKDILKQTKKSLVKQAKAGRLSVNGRYQFISPDLYAFCEWLFLGEQNPKGLLANGEVYSSLNPNEIELACLRSPHLYREWAIKTNKRNSETDKWFGMTKCVYTSVFDTCSKLLQFD